MLVKCRGHENICCASSGSLSQSQSHCRRNTTCSFRNTEKGVCFVGWGHVQWHMHKKWDLRREERMIQHHMWHAEGAVASTLCAKKRNSQRKPGCCPVLQCHKEWGSPQATVFWLKVSRRHVTKLASRQVWLRTLNQSALIGLTCEDLGPPQ